MGRASWTVAGADVGRQLLSGYPDGRLDVLPHEAESPCLLLLFSLPDYANPRSKNCTAT